METEHSANLTSDIAPALRHALTVQSPAGVAWLDDALASLGAGGSDRPLFTLFAAAPRQVGRHELPELQPAPDIRLHGWTRDQAARLLLLLGRRPRDESFLQALDSLFAAADLTELVCLYQSLPWLPLAERHVARAAEGVRSNMLPVFRAIAVGNPYPQRWFDDGAWNQMVLKALFVGCSLHAITGLDSRANPALARMLVDYARERRAAGRVVPAELWRPVGPFTDSDRALHEVRHAFADPDPMRRQAAALALAASPHPAATALLASRPDLAEAVRHGRLSWRSLARDQAALPAAA